MRGPYTTDTELHNRLCYDFEPNEDDWHLQRSSVSAATLNRSDECSSTLLCVSSSCHSLSALNVALHYKQ